MRELLEKISQQLEVFIESNYWPNTHILLDEIKAELAKPEPEPVAWITTDFRPKSLITENEQIARGWDLDGIPNEPLYTHLPAQQKPLSDDEIKQISEPYLSMFNNNFDMYIDESEVIEFARDIERKVRGE